MLSIRTLCNTNEYQYIVITSRSDRAVKTFSGMTQSKKDTVDNHV